MNRPARGATRMPTSRMQGSRMLLAGRKSIVAFGCISGALEWRLGSHPVSHDFRGISGRLPDAVRAPYRPTRSPERSFFFRTSEITLFFLSANFPSCAEFQRLVRIRSIVWQAVFILAAAALRSSS
jgi:hypothetical protein